MKGDNVDTVALYIMVALSFGAADFLAGWIIGSLGLL